MRRTKILFTTPTLAFGGAERVLLTLLKHLDRSQYDPVLVTLSKTGPYVSELPADGLRVYDLKRRGRLSFPLLVVHMMQIFHRERPNVAIGVTGLANFVLLTACRLMKKPVPVIVSEHITPTQMYNSSEEPLGWIKKLLIKRLYPHTHVIIAVSQGVRNDLINHFGLKVEKIQVIYDPVDLERIRTLSQEKVSHPWFENGTPIILSAGRLTAQKDYPMLIKAFTLVKSEIPAKLVILGDGPEMPRLKKLTHRLGIAQEVAFLGYQQNPYKYMRYATLFALSSRFEGFGLVLVEAMALGLPVVATRCPSGPDEILENGTHGLLVPVGNHQALAQAMISLIKDRELHTSLAKKGMKRAMDFSVQKIVREYERCIISVQSFSAEHLSRTAEKNNHHDRA